MNLNELKIPTWWFLYFEIDLTEDLKVVDIKRIMRSLNGEAKYVYPHGNTISGEIAFRSAEEAGETRKALRRLSRGQPRFTVNKVAISSQYLIASASTRTQM